MTKHAIWCLLAITPTLAPMARAQADDFSWLRQELLTHCGKCHGEKEEAESDVNLVSLKAERDLATKLPLVEQLVRVLRDQRMPPNTEPPLAADTRQQMLDQLQGLHSRTVRTYPFPPTPLRRMNRFQYNNAVVDLLELDRDIFQLNERLLRRREPYFQPATRKMPAQIRVSCRPLSKDIDNERPEGFNGVAAFPQDKRAEHGFDNRADHLTMSPLLMESFLQLSQSLADSSDLNARECRSWKWLFERPADDAMTPATLKTTLKTRLEKLLRRAMRHPSDEKALERFVTFAERQLAEGMSWEECMRTVVGGVLAMPDFLLVYESHPESTGTTETAARQRITDYELATRLSLFLWSSIPDDELLNAAEAGKLSDPAFLSHQIDRMLDDPKSSRFCDNFPAQWLQLDRLITSIPDPQQFPYFYYNGYRTSMHMMSEPLLLFETVFVEDRSILDLLAPDFTWESDMLRQNYAGESKSGHDVKVQTFRRVPVRDPSRGGVITNAAVMTMTSTPLRTQPITRGAWLNEVIFNDPPKPPPADVPPLPEVDKEQLAKLTIRERLAAHRQRADCAGCHDRIDPLGFALENFGPTGVWRASYENGREIDASGRLFDRHDFRTTAEFKSILLKEKSRFIRAFVAHLLSYSLARELGPADTPTLDDITARAVAGEDRLRTILKAIATSESFLHKSAPRKQETP
jgi:hypothetical protein